MTSSEAEAQGLVILQLPFPTKSKEHAEKSPI